MVFLDGRSGREDFTFLGEDFVKVLREEDFIFVFEDNEVSMGLVEQKSV